MNTIFHFKIKGMYCVSCALQVERAISSVENVKKAQVNFVSEKASVEVDFSSPSLVKAIAKAIQGEGYEARLIHHKNLSHEPLVKEHHLFRLHPKYIDLSIAILFTLPLVAHMVGFYVSPYFQLVCASVVQFWAGRHFYQAAWKSVKRLTSNMDLLVVLGTSAAYIYSFFGVFLHFPALYFETGAVVMTLVLLGRCLEDRAKRSANAAVRSLMKLTPPTALVEKDGVYVESLSDEVQKGDHLMVRAWQRIPVDGFVFRGTSEVDESMITGESIPVLKAEGDKVIGGARNTSGVLYLEATTLGNQSTLSRLIRLVEEAQSSRPPIQKFVDQVSAVFVPAVLLISLVTFGGWLVVNSSFQHALLSAISVLVIACPCALGLATPTAIVVAMGAAARKGILMKDLESLEALRKVDVIVFDKTGTLTKGEFSLTIAKSFSGFSQDQLILTAASLQKGSEHPVAKAFLKGVKGKKLLDVIDFLSFPGKGVQGKVNETLYFLGSKEFMEEQGIEISSSRMAEQTVIYLAEKGGLLGIFYLMDIPRRRAPEALQALKAMGLKTVMLTGDRKEAAHMIGKKVGIDDVIAQLQPKDKVNYIKAQEQRHHLVAMVGDGVNDGPALAAATVGFAMGSGTDVAMDAASITLMRPALELIPQAFLLSKKTFRIIQENLFWAFVFNVVGIGYAAFGYLSPEIAGGAMAASSIIVVMNSLRLKKG